MCGPAPRKANHFAQPAPQLNPPRRRRMKKILAALAPLTLVLPLAASSSVASAAHMTMMTAHLKGSSEVGAAGAKNGTGTATITVDMSRHKLCYTLKVSGFKLPALAAHIHAGNAGVNGNVVVPFPTAPGKNGKASGCTTVKAKLLTAITKHPSSYYVNVH